MNKEVLLNMIFSSKEPKEHIMCTICNGEIEKKEDATIIIAEDIISLNHISCDMLMGIKKLENNK